MVEVDLTILILGVLGMVVTGIIGLRWVTLKGLHIEKGGDLGELYNKKLKVYQDLANEYEADAKHWKGKFNQTKQKLTVDGDFNVENQGDLADLAKMIVPNILEFLPQEVAQKARGLLDNPDVIDLVAKLYKDHPTEIKSIASGFLKRARGGGNQVESETNQQIQYAEHGA